MGDNRTLWAGVVVVALLVATTGSASAIDLWALDDYIVEPDSEDGDCSINYDSPDRYDSFVCGLLPLTHVMARIDISDNGSSDSDIIQQTQSTTCEYTGLEAHASVKPWLPSTYEYSLRIEVDGAADAWSGDGSLDGYEEMEKTGPDPFNSYVEVVAEVENTYLNGRDLYNDNGVRISLPYDRAYAKLRYDCGTDEWTGTTCEIDGELEEQNPPSRCEGNVQLP